MISHTDIRFSIVLHTLVVTLTHGFLFHKDHFSPAWITVPKMMPTTTPRVPTTLPVCRNNILNCADYGSPDYACHGQYKDWAKQNCNQYCGFCTGMVTLTAPLIKPTVALALPTTAQPMPTTALPMPTTALPMPTSSAKCMDKISNCRHYYGDKAHACHGQFEPWARRNCALYCGFCNITMSPTPLPGCHYNKTHYNEGDVWQDGCQYNCTCKDGKTGFYVCKDLCPKYINVPLGCKFIVTPGECCAKPDCSLGQHNILPLTTGATHRTPPTMSVPTVSTGCVYKGHVYHTGDTWKDIDGCIHTYNCTCINGDIGFYKCDEICHTYTNLPSGCHLVTKPGETCAKPSCTGTQTVTGTCQTFGGNNTHTGVNTSCYYGGKAYSVGQTWDDGCFYHCNCLNQRGQYQCRQKCLSWKLPDVCFLSNPKPGKCCSIPVCPPGVIVKYPDGYQPE